MRPILIAILLAGLGMVGLELQQGGDRRQQVEAALADPVTPRGELPSLQLTEAGRRFLPGNPDTLTDRPLFFEGRAEPVEPPSPPAKAPPPSAAAPPPPDAPPPKGVVLTGVVIINQERTGLVWDPKARATHHLRIGGELEGWRVLAVAEDQLVLGLADKRHQLTLRDYANLPQYVPPEPRQEPAADPQAALEKAAAGQNAVSADPKLQEALEKKPSFTPMRWDPKP